MGYYSCPDEGHRDVVCLCGSTRFREEFEQIQLELSLQGMIVLSVGCFGHRGDLPPEACQDGHPVKTNLDSLHLRKIEMASEVYVIDPGGYIGTSTRREIEHALYYRRRLRFFSQEKEGCTPPEFGAARAIIPGSVG